MDSRLALFLLALSTTGPLAVPLAGPLAGQSPRLVIDLDRTPNVRVAESKPRLLTRAGNAILFAATRPDVGEEPFITSGAASGAKLVADLDARYPKSRVRSITPLNNRFLLVKEDISFGNSLWSTDGTTTVRLTPQLSFPFPSHVGSNGSLALFTGLDERGDELWRTDGTRAGTAFVADLAPGPASSAPHDFVAAGAQFFFVATDAAGAELWTSDGTAAGTRRVADIRAGSAGSAPRALTPFGNGILFVADDGTQGDELWISDGTQAGTKAVADINPGAGGSAISAITVAGGRAWFTASDAQGAEPWLSDGTPAGTRRVADIRSGAAGSFPLGYTAFLGRVWFGADDGVSGRELWSSDGTAAGTRLERDIAPGAASSGPTSFAVGGPPTARVLLFSASDFRGFELWSSDGTALGTRMVLEIYPGAAGAAPHELVALPSGEVCFVATDPQRGMELWSTLGTPASTVLVADIATTPAGATLGSDLSQPMPMGDATLLFRDRPGALELWRTDGSAAGTTRVSLLGAPASALPVLGRAGGLWVFQTIDTQGVVGWATDGTAAGTQQIWTFTGPQPSPWPGASYRGKVWFAAADLAGNELWCSDGTNAGTQGFDLAPGGASSDPAFMVALAGRLLFVATSATQGRELWSSDGTAQGTQVLADIQPGPGGSAPGPIVVAGPYAYFSADDGRSGIELWRTDGTRAGTVMVTDLRPGAASSNAAPMAALAGGLFFLADDGARGFEPWWTDGTAAGTGLVRDFTPGAPGTGVQWVGTASGRGVIRVSDDGPGMALWSTDGTAAGTTPLPGRGESFGAVLASAGHLWFAAVDAAGRELWRTDGTAAGTARVADLAPGGFSSNPVPLAFAGDEVLFVADDGVLGTELWAVEAGALVRELGAGCAAGRAAPRLRATAPVLGQTTTITVDGLRPPSAGVLAAGLPRDLPLATLDGCDLFVAPGAFAVLLAWTAGGAGVSLPVQVPNLPSLKGITVTLQAATGPSTTAIGIDLTNGLALTAGR